MEVDVMMAILALSMTFALVVHAKDSKLSVKHLISAINLESAMLRPENVNTPMLKTEKSAMTEMHALRWMNAKTEFVLEPIQLSAQLKINATKLENVMWSLEYVQTHNNQMEHHVMMQMHALKDLLANLEFAKERTGLYVPPFLNAISQEFATVQLVFVAHPQDQLEDIVMIPMVAL